jgi:hypothetical protein
VKTLFLFAVLCSFGCAMETVDSERSAEGQNQDPNDPNHVGHYPVGVNPPPVHKTYDEACPNMRQVFAGSCRLTGPDGNLAGCADIDSSIGILGKPECTGLFANVPCSEVVAASPKTEKVYHNFGTDNVCYTVRVFTY